MIFGHGDGYLTIRKSHSPSRVQPPLFVVNEACKTESDEAAATFHTTIVAKTLYDVTVLGACWGTEELGWKRGSRV
jgi:hypothetical protein